MDENEILRKQLHESNKSFNFTEFFSYDGNEEHGATDDKKDHVATNGKKGHGATGLITSSQSITIPNIDNYSGHHITTTEQIIKAIYDLPDKEKQKELTSLYTDIMKQSIQITLINEHSVKLIIIQFPPQITKEQLNLLIAYENTYGNIVEQFSEPYERENKQKIVVFQKHTGEASSCHSFKEAIQYSKDLPKIEKPDIEDKFIIGSVVSYDKMTLHCPDLPISLQELAQQASDNGTTMTDCYLAAAHENLPEHHRTGVSINE